MNTATRADRVNEFIGRYAPGIARDFKAARKKMRAMVPRGYELVYDTYNALGIGYAPNEKSVIVSIVAYPRWISLFFMRGSTLSDPQSLLQGSGRRIRSIRLESPDDLDRPAVQRLIAQALQPHAEALAQCPKIKTLMKAVTQKRRPRRPSLDRLSEP
jgi:hypothetical protein